MTDETRENEREGNEKMLSINPLTMTPIAKNAYPTRNDPEDPRFGEVIIRHENGEESDRQVDETTGVVLLGVPQDLGVCRNGGRAGAAGGPDAIRQRLYRLATWDAEVGRSIEPGFIADPGDITCGEDLEEIHDRLTTVTGAIIGSGKVPVIIGGGHDITYGAFCGVFNELGPLGAFNFDAHLDVRPATKGRNSGTSFRMLIEEEKIDVTRFVEFGIQPFANAAAHAAWFTEQGGTIRTLETIRRIGLDESLAGTLAVTREQNRPYYATLDLDAVRAAEAPGVSAPSPDGFSAAELLTVARALGSDPWCVALDIAEMNPEYDQDAATARLAAAAIARFAIGVAARVAF